ncbi:hypothetical protein [Dactylosporangium sp. NPDC048998]|uniref:hypothetical protein n=1 Tax=Dactylosporangium sp. NPDC048998 TaxID=3363976 RepID=UPI003711BADF
MSEAYERYAVPELWLSVADENTANNTTHEHAWSHKHSLLDDQIKKLGELRRDLVTYWNPAASAAAQAFVDQIDAAITAMTDARDAAARVKSTYEAVASAVMEARHQLEPLQASYGDPKAAWKSYLKNTPASSLVNLMPDGWNPGMGLPPVLSDAVLKSHQDELDARARSIMQAADQRIAAATTEPATFPTMAVYNNGTAPPVPEQKGGRGGNGGDGRYLPRPVFDPPPPSSRPVASAPGIGPLPGAVDPGPFLTGAPAHVSPPVLTAPPAPPITPPVTSPSNDPIPSLPSEVGWTTRAPSGQRVMRSGGLIERPGPIERPGAIGGPASRASGQRGGKVSKPGTGAADNVTRTDERTPAGGWRDRSYEAYARRNADRKRNADDQWQVKEGVTPILESPDPPPPNDATPGVIGIDR